MYHELSFSVITLSSYSKDFIVPEYIFFNYTGLKYTGINLLLLDSFEV